MKRSRDKKDENVKGYKNCWDMEKAIDNKKGRREKQGKGGKKLQGALKRCSVHIKQRRKAKGGIVSMKKEMQGAIRRWRGNLKDREGSVKGMQVRVIPE